MAASRQANLRAIMDWSLRQQGQGGAAQSAAHDVTTDPARRQFLAEALEAVVGVAAPGESDQLKQCIAVLRADMLRSASSEEAEGSAPPDASSDHEARQSSPAPVSQLEEALQYMLYLVEDIDHAKDLIPMGGVKVIADYLTHPNTDLVCLACDVIATATQNNPPCQEAFLPCLSRLLALVSDDTTPSATRIKALYAVSCLSRECDAGCEELLKRDGISVLLCCLHSPVEKLTIKSLFILSSLYTTASSLPSISDALQSKLPSVVSELAGLVQSAACVPEVLGHCVSALASVVRDKPRAAELCRDPRLSLREALERSERTLAGAQYEDERENIGEILSVF